MLAGKLDTTAPTSPSMLVGKPQPTAPTSPSMLVGKPYYIEYKFPLAVNVSLSDELWAVAKNYTQIQVRSALICLIWLIFG
jgi:hypothetical protein